MSTPTVLFKRFSEDMSASVQSSFLPLAGVAKPVAVARRYTLAILDRWGMSGEVCSDATLVASELTANAEVHTPGGPENIVLMLHGNHLIIAVRDNSSQRPVIPRARHHSNEDAECGRGLMIVRGLAHRLGCESNRAYKTVWADLVISSGSRPITATVDRDCR